jgi:dynactin complex subunit
MNRTSHQVEVDRLYKELEEVKTEMKFYYNHGHNNEEINSKYKKILSKIYNIKPRQY